MPNSNKFYFRLKFEKFRRRSPCRFSHFWPKKQVCSNLVSGQGLTCWSWISSRIRYFEKWGAQSVMSKFWSFLTHPARVWPYLWNSGLKLVSPVEIMMLHLCAKFEEILFSLQIWKISQNFAGAVLADFPIFGQKTSLLKFAILVGLDMLMMNI